MSKKKYQTYTVQVKLDLFLDTEIKAESFEQALEQAKGIAVTDVVDILGNYNDGEIEVTGIFK